MCYCDFGTGGVYLPIPVRVNDIYCKKSIIAGIDILLNKYN